MPPAPPAEFPSVSRWWLAAAIAFKLLLAVGLSWQQHRLAGKPFQLHVGSGDEASYFDPIERLIAERYYNAEPDRPEAAAGRMPGYGAPYLLFRGVLSPDAAKDALVVLQAVLSGASVYYLALCALLLWRRKDVFYGVLVLYGLNLIVSIWDMYMMTESLAASSAIFFGYNLLRWRERPTTGRMLLAGAWFAWLVFLRPFAVPLFLLALVVIWEQRRKQARPFGPMVRDALLGVSALLITIIPWTVRNYLLLGKFVPLQVDTTAGYYYTPAQKELRTWFGTVGHSAVWWEPNTLASWFYKDPAFTNENYPLPAYVETSRCSLDDLRRARQAFVAARAEKDLARRLQIEAPVGPIISSCRESFRQEKPLAFLVTSPLRILKTFLVHSGPVLPLPRFSETVRSPPLLMLKLFGVGMYWLVLVAGTIGLVLLARRPLGWLLAWPLLLVIALFVFFMRLPETRFLVTAFPSLGLAASYLLAPVASRVIARVRPLLGRRRDQELSGRPTPT